MDVDRFVRHQGQKGLAPATINRRLNALKSFYEFLFSNRDDFLMPIKPSHYVKQGQTLPKKLSNEEIKKLFGQIKNKMDKTMFLLMLRCGLRVSEIANLKPEDIDWEQRALLVRQGKGRKDRRVYLSKDK